MTAEHITLFLLHHAGGNKYAYHCFKNLFPPELKLELLELPGRGARMGEALTSDIHASVADIYDQIIGKLDKPYIFLGHSMGSVLAYLLTRKIIGAGKKPPVRLFLSGRMGPAYFEDSVLQRSALPRKEFADELRELGGVPPQILEDESAMDFFEPIIRADFKALETYTYIQDPKLDVPVTVLLGKEDHTAQKEGIKWQEVTHQPVDTRYFDGGHFFIFDKAKDIASVIIEQSVMRLHNQAV